MYVSDPSGNYAAWRANATGKNAENARSILKDDYEEGLSLKDATLLAAKVLSKSMDMHKPDAARFEIGIITKNEAGEVVQRNVEGAELDSILANAKLFEEEEKKQ